MKTSYAKPQNAVEIYRLGKSIKELNFSKKYPFHELSEIKEFIKKPKENIVFIAKENNKITGFLYARILSHHAGGWCMLDNLAVSKESRNNGIATELLHRLYKELKKRKINYIQILEANNKKTKKFWKQKGYKKTKTFIWCEKTI